jgi:flagellar biosynthesis/type III secretory pathway ATPase
MKEAQLPASSPITSRVAYLADLEPPIRAESGTVTQVVGLLVESEGPAAGLGGFCRSCSATAAGADAGYRIPQWTASLGTRSRKDGLQVGDTIIAGARRRCRLEGNCSGGCDGFGRPMDGRPCRRGGHLSALCHAARTAGAAVDPEPLVTGIRARWHAAVRQGTAHWNLRRERRRKSTLLGAMSET